MPSDNKTFEKAIAEQDDHLAAILDGITEGVVEGVKKGVSDGLREGLKDGLKDCLSEGFDSLAGVDFGQVLKEVIEDSARASLRNTARSIVSKPAARYMREVCVRIVSEITRRDVELNDNDIRQIEELVLQTEQRMLKMLPDKIPDNPFIREIAAGIQSALEDSLQKELVSCRERLIRMRGNH